MVHQYVFEFKYKKVVFGKERELTHEVNVLDNNYQSACKKAIEHTKDHFEQWNDEGSSFKYVGEKINGVLKPFVEEVKEEECMLIGKSKKELVNLNKGLMIDVNVQKNEIKTLKQRCENNQQKIESLQKRVDGFKAKANYIGGLPFVEEVKEEKKMKTYVEMYEEMCGVQKKVEQLEKRVDGFKAKEKQQPYILDVNSMYPQAVDVCKVYQIERDQALKENEELKNRVKYLIERNNRFEVNEKYYDEEYRKLSDEKKTREGVINWYKKEIGRLNMIIDDMENRLEKQVVARDGMLKQLREYKVEKKRMNKIIDALTEDK